MLFWVFGKKNAQLGHYNHFHTVYKSPPRHDEDYIYKSPHTYINISITNMTSLTNLFSLVFAFLQTALNFSSILSILFISSSVNFLAKFVRNFMQTGRNRTTTTKHHYDIKGTYVIPENIYDTIHKEGFGADPPHTHPLIISLWEFKVLFTLCFRNFLSPPHLFGLSLGISNDPPWGRYYGGFCAKRTFTVQNSPKKMCADWLKIVFL